MLGIITSLPFMPWASVDAFGETLMFVQHCLSRGKQMTRQRARIRNKLAMNLSDKSTMSQTVQAIPANECSCNGRCNGSFRSYHVPAF